MRILILCTGNSCRSQMAHGFMQSFDHRLQVFSAGTAPADRVNPRAIAVMSEIGIDISSHTPHHIAEYLGERWNYVITVCGGANESFPTFTGCVGHRIHIGFDDPSDATGTQEYVLNAFRKIRDEIHRTLFEYYNNNIASQL